MMTEANRPAWPASDAGLADIQRALACTASGDPEASHATHLPANQPPWQSTGLSLRRGQAYTLFAGGRVRWSPRHPHLHGGPGFHLWARVAPDGRIVNLVRDTSSFVADVDGELELGMYLGAWRDDRGTLDTPRAAFERLAGGLDVLALTWRGTALEGLTELARRCVAAPIARELARLRANASPPAGWDYLIEAGISDIFRACDDHGHACIRLDAEDDQGILRRPVDFPLGPDTRIAWRWKVDAHPSRVAEDSHLSHDYVSVAAEFDNGRDLTWMWSSALPREHWFACPIRAWSARETHLVVRSGLDDLGQWCAEERGVYGDVARAMGAPPARIVALWLICVATFQHGVARATFTDLELRDGERRLRVV